MLKLIVRHQNVVDEVLAVESTRLVEKDLKRVDCMPHKVTDEELVTVTRIEKFLSIDAWKSLNTAIDKLKDTPWECEVCCKDLDDKDSIGCDVCLN